VRGWWLTVAARQEHPAFGWRTPSTLRFASTRNGTLFVPPFGIWNKQEEW
jgi:hypothetical protein